MIAAAVQWRLETHDRLTSTSDACRQAALAGAPEGLAIRATQQTAGRGTNGRSWASPPGNLYLSLLLRPSIPPREASHFSLHAGLAVAEALQAHAPKPLSLKWPNDVLLNGAKLAGILVETAATGDTLDWMIIGIGANLAIAPTLPDRATASLNAQISPEPAAHAVLARLGAWETRRSAEGFAPIRAAWSGYGGGVLGSDGHLVGG